MSSRKRTRAQLKQQRLQLHDSDSEGSVEEVTAAQVAAPSSSRARVAVSPAGSLSQPSRSAQSTSSASKSSAGLSNGSRTIPDPIATEVDPNLSHASTEILSSPSPIRGDPLFPEVPLPPIEDLIAPLRSRKPLPYDPCDRKSIAQYHQTRIDAQFPFRCLPQSPPFSPRFLLPSGPGRFDQLLQRPIHEEKLIIPNGTSAYTRVRSILELNNLERTVNEELIQKYPRDVILEFYANLSVDAIPENCLIPVFVRGYTFEFSPRMINRVCGCDDFPFTPCVNDKQLSPEITMKISQHDLAWYLSGKRVQNWSDIRPQLLTHTVACVHALCCLNWMPTTNNTALSVERATFLYMLLKQKDFNFGKLVFDQVISAAKSSKKVLPFPRLIYQVLEFQRSVELLPHELQVPEPLAFNLDSRFGAERKKIPKQHFYVGASLAGTLRHIASLALAAADKLEGGDYADEFNASILSGYTSVDTINSDAEAGSQGEN